MSIVDEVRQILAAAKPANGNCPRCSSGLRPASGSTVERLLSDLEAYKPIGRTWERPTPRLVLNPTAEQRAAAGGRKLP